MTIYTAPPNRDGLVLGVLDTLVVEAGGSAKNTTINNGGFVEVEAGGHTDDTTVNEGGTESVLGVVNRTTINGGTEAVGVFGTTVGTTINDRGVEFVSGSSLHTTINTGGSEIVHRGTAEDTTINNGGVEVVEGGIANNVTFGSVGGKLELLLPSGLEGTINNWHVGDVVDLMLARVTALTHLGDLLLVVYDNPRGFNQLAIYKLADQQPDTKVTAASDGHGGTNLVLTPVVGVPHQHDDPGHHFFS